MSDTVQVSATDVQIVSDVLTLAARAFGSALGTVPHFGDALEACGRMAIAAERAQLPEDPVGADKALAIVYSEMVATFCDAGLERHEAFRLVEIQAQAAAQLGLMKSIHG